MSKNAACDQSDGSVECDAGLKDDGACATDPCQHGVCVETDASAGYSCECDTDYEGKNCDKAVAECTGGCGDGICDLVDGQPVCFCPPGRSGDHCEVAQTGDCADSCSGHGTCVSRSGRLECVCEEGYTGMACESPDGSLSPADALDFCAEHSCVFGACVSKDETYACECEAEVTGEFCERVADPCGMNPCQNGGTCEPSGADFQCSCRAGYAGTTCEVNVDDCADEPCVHGACVDGVNGFVCSCELAWAGPRCDKPVANGCDDNPCDNGGRCIAAADGYSCACAVGFSGAQCELNDDDCAGVTSCGLGICEDGLGSYRCTCPGEMSGTGSTICECPPGQRLHAARGCVTPTFHTGVRIPAAREHSVAVAYEGSGAFSAPDLNVSAGEVYLYSKWTGLRRATSSLVREDTRYERQLVGFAGGRVLVVYNPVESSGSAAPPPIVALVNAQGAWVLEREVNGAGRLALGGNGSDVAFVVHHLSMGGALVERWGSEGPTGESYATDVQFEDVSVTPDGKAFLSKWDESSATSSWSVLLSAEAGLSSPEWSELKTSAADMHNGNFGVLARGSTEFAFDSLALRAPNPRAPYLGQVSGTDAKGNMFTVQVQEDNQLHYWVYTVGARWENSTYENAELAEGREWLLDTAEMDIAPSGEAVVAWLARNETDDSFEILAARYSPLAGVFAAQVIGTTQASFMPEIQVALDAVGDGLVTWADDEFAHIVALY